MKASVTLAAIATLAVKVGASEDAIVREYNAFLHANEFRCHINQPMQVTEKKGGAFSKVPLIGGEIMTTIGAYLGKRDGVIIQLRSKSKLIEIPANLIESGVDNYETYLAIFINKYGLENDTAGMIVARSEADLLEQQAHQEALLETRKKDLRFGSW